MLLALAIAPQRSTLYGNLVRFLAPAELRASPAGTKLRRCEYATLGGQEYLLIELADELTGAERAALDRLATISARFEFFERIGATAGPLLRPITSTWQPFLPAEIVETRRYRGKTSEPFTAALLNFGLFAGGYAGALDTRLRVLDPLAGGGTTLFTALTRGYDAVGIERERPDVESTDTYVRQFLRGVGIPFKRTDERVRGHGRRYLFTIGRGGDTRTLGLILGDARQPGPLLEGLPGGARFHAVVADLPYGIQHQGQVEELLRDAVPRWADTLLPGGTLALAWESSRLKRPEAIKLVEGARRGLRVVDVPPFDGLAHRVDRAIKRRDILVVRDESP